MPFALMGLLFLGGFLGYRYRLVRQRHWNAHAQQAAEILSKAEAKQRFLIDHLVAGVRQPGKQEPEWVLRKAYPEFTADQALRQWW